ncbi:MAG: hypothetical protein AB202_00345 [Parcubacteria bacterium C7867-007]|nr:MAG: hypothetical protein AB202_00345 [Parcubacteria bacterium C7867-007]
MRAELFGGLQYDHRPFQGSVPACIRAEQSDPERRAAGDRFDHEALARLAIDHFAGTMSALAGPHMLDAGEVVDIHLTGSRDVSEEIALFLVSESTDHELAFTFKIDLTACHCAVTDRSHTTDTCHLFSPQNPLIP